VDIVYILFSVTLLFPRTIVKFHF